MSSTSTVTLTIDNRPVTVPAGTLSQLSTAFQTSPDFNPRRYARSPVNGQLLLQLGDARQQAALFLDELQRHVHLQDGII